MAEQDNPVGEYLRRLLSARQRYGWRIDIARHVAAEYAALDNVAAVEDNDGFASLSVLPRTVTVNGERQVVYDPPGTVIRRSEQTLAKARSVTPTGIAADYAHAVEYRARRVDARVRGIPSDLRSVGYVPPDRPPRLPTLVSLTAAPHGPDASGVTLAA